MCCDVYVCDDVCVGYDVRVCGLSVCGDVCVWGVCMMVWRCV